MSEWQPIETAPKDGTRVLLFRRGWAESVSVGWWGGLWETWNVAGGITSEFVHPTHWMPIPEPPE